MEERGGIPARVFKNSVSRLRKSKIINRKGGTPDSGLIESTNSPNIPALFCLLLFFL